MKRLLSAVAVALGLAPAAGQAAEPRSVAPHAAPAAWIAYAQLVSEAVQARLAADDPAAVRLHAYLDQLPGVGQPEGVTLTIAFWVDAAGSISRIDFPPFVQAEPDADLNALMVGLKLPQAPPKDMLLPLRLAIQLRPKDPPKP